MNITIPLLPILIAAPVLSVAFLVSLPWIARRTDFVSITRRHLHRFAPLYFVAGPAAVTCFAVCGTISAIATILFVYAHGAADATHDHLIESGVFTMLKWVEFSCSLLGGCAFPWLIRWVGLSRFWEFIAVISLAVSAAYRTARQGPGPEFGTGPGIRFSAEWLDTIPVLLGFGLFLMFRYWPGSKTRTASHDTAAADS